MTDPSGAVDLAPALTASIALVRERDALRAERDELTTALRDLQSGIAQYLADPLRKKTCAHAELFIEVCGEQIVAALSKVRAIDR